MKDRILSLIGEKYHMVPLPVSEEYSSMKVSGMKFSVSAWNAEGLGHVSLMCAKGFFGLMKMDTIVIVPIETDLPLLSYDRIKAAGNDTLMIELYDTLVSPWDSSPLGRIKDSFPDIPERDPGKHWYDKIRLSESISKKGKRKDEERMDALTGEFIKAYLSGKANTTEDRERKKKKTEQYVSGLISNGGPSTDVFVKKFGKEKTKYFFENVLFASSI